MIKPRVNEITPNFYQFVGVGRSAHVYLLKGNRRTVMVDCGLPDSKEYLIECLNTIEVPLEKIDLLLLTHEHLDHSGGASFFAQYAPVAAHKHAANKLRLSDEFSMMSSVFNQSTEAFHTDILLSEGTEFSIGGFSLEIVHTPGHCSGSVCFYEHATKTMITADTIMGNGVIGGVLNSGNTSDYITSLERLMQYNISCLLPGHGKISIEPYKDIQIGITHLGNLLNDSHALFGSILENDPTFGNISELLRGLNIK